MFRDWATQRRRDTFLQRDRHSQPASQTDSQPQSPDRKSVQPSIRLEYATRQVSLLLQSPFSFYRLIVELVIEAVFTPSLLQL